MSNPVCLVTGVGPDRGTGALNHAHAPQYRYRPAPEWGSEWTPQVGVVRVGSTMARI